MSNRFNKKGRNYQNYNTNRNRARKIDAPQIVENTVRIHYAPDCKCKRFYGEKEQIEQGQIGIIIERPLSIYRPSDPIYYYCLDTNPDSLHKLFSHSLDDRLTIYDYFKSYSLGVPQSEYLQGIENNKYCWMSGLYVSDYLPQWDKRAAQYIRELTRTVPSASLCITDPSRALWLGHNGGCVVIGDIKRLKTIARVFNKMVDKTEFKMLEVLRLDEIDQYPRKKDSCLRIYSSLNRKLTYPDNHDLAILIGINEEGLAKLSFGKREWYGKYTECSRQCAMRELFEEFHIQFGHEALKSSRNWLDANNIEQTLMWVGGGIFHHAYVSNTTTVRYDRDSQTIGIGY